MICKNCGANVKEGQFSCSSCGAYLTKDSTVNTTSLEERSNLSSGSDLYSYKPPVIVNDGWKWYTFVTWGLVPLFVISIVLDLLQYFQLSFLLGLLAIAYVILGCVTFSKLQGFTENSRYYLYVFLCMPVVLLLASCSAAISKVELAYGRSVDISMSDVLKQGKVIGSILFYGILLIVNIIYFGNRKEDFKY